MDTSRSKLWLINIVSSDYSLNSVVFKELVEQISKTLVCTLHVESGLFFFLVIPHMGNLKQAIITTVFNEDLPQLSS